MELAPRFLVGCVATHHPTELSFSGGYLPARWRRGHHGHRGARVDALSSRSARTRRGPVKSRRAASGNWRRIGGLMRRRRPFWSASTVRRSFILPSRKAVPAKPNLCHHKASNSRMGALSTALARCSGGHVALAEDAALSFAYRFHDRSISKKAGSSGACPSGRRP